MERLTEQCWRNLDPWECCGQDNFCKRGCHDLGGCTNGCIVPKLYARLASYEDTGLDVEEYKKHADAIKKLDIEHMHDLLQAEKDGTLVVMSPNIPLTPEELRNLALKKWVWIDVMDESKEYGAGSAYYRKSDCYNSEEVFSCGYPGWKIVFEYADYGKTWLAYRQKPKEETHGQNKN